MVRAFALLLCLWMAGCTRVPGTREASAQEHTESFGRLYPVPVSREADDAGRFLAGLPGKEGSAFLPLESTPAWEAHRAALDREWARGDARAFPAMREFERLQVKPAAEKIPAVIYPFSGPDTLAATTFFPGSPLYIMAGLEPPGTIPEPSEFPAETLEANLAGGRESVYSQLRRSFFVTREMDRHFRGQAADGLLSPILHLLVRTGHTVIGYAYVQLDEQGNVKPRGASEQTLNRGVAVAFRTDADQSAHELLYFTLNLADNRLRQNKGFLALLDRARGSAAYFKATSYMPHHKNFSVIREKILANCRVILQDDSGIPFRYFTPGEWKVQLYGSYHEPYGSFRWLRQTDLQDAYSKASAKPLGFAIGYGYSRAPSNLLLATRVRLQAKAPAGP